MKLFERIFLYSIIAILAFHVFLADNQVESQVAIQEEVRAKKIVVVNDEGNEVLSLSFGYEGGLIEAFNKNGDRGAVMGAGNNGGAVAIFREGVIGAAMAMAIAADEGGAVETYNAEGFVGTAMGSGANGGEVWIYDQEGENPLFYGHAE